MFKKILLPLDLTGKHESALRVAAEMAGQSGGEVTLLHVIEMISGLSREEDKDFYGRLERTARQHLDRCGKSLGKVPWRAEIRYGHRALEAANFAKETGCDLIVLTAPPFDAEHPLAGWGSMSWKIGVLAPCPVLFVK